MWGDYGYMEDDGQKTYDLRHIKRFLGYARPYTALLLLTCVLILLATAADLALPYLTKIAIDRYIQVYAQVVEVDDPDFQADRMPFLVPSGREGLYFLPASAAEKMDPEDKRRLADAGALKDRYVFLIQKPTPAAREVIQARPNLFTAYPRVTVIDRPDFEDLGLSDIRRLRQNDITGLLNLAFLAVVILLVGYLFSFTQVILLEYAGQRVTHDLRQALARHVFYQSIRFHDQTAVGRLVARLTNDVQNLSEMIKNVAVTFFKDAFILIGIVGLLIYINPALALVTFLLLPPIAVTTWVFRRKARSVFRELRRKVSQINHTFGESIAGLRVIQAFVRQSRNQKQFEELNHENFLAGMRQVRVFAVFMPLIDLLAAAALGLIIWYGGWGVMRETMTLGAVVAFIGYVRKFFQPIRELAEKFNILQSAMASLERIFNLMDHEDRQPEPEHPRTPDTTAGHIAFEEVTFGYDPEHPVLKDVSFEVQPGRTLAIVGATGSGKTSIINLLLRFYDPDRGRILVDGRDLRDLDLQAHRRRVSLVMQDVLLFAGTVRENIAFARDDLDPEAVEAAAEAVKADRFIRELPQGYDQRLGEGGLTLSIGQRQLLALARALVQDPQILVLDEATAFIDSETEQLIAQAIGRLAADRTSIIIAHRLSTIRRADLILVMDRGRIVEAGDHEELMAKSGFYYRLHGLQQRENLVAG